MKQIIRDASGYYLLGYNSTQAPTDGKFHEIKVRVTRRNVDVRARKGYWPTPRRTSRARRAPPTPDAPSAVTAALNAIAEPPRGRAARFWIGMAKGAERLARVTFAWEPMSREDAQARGAESGASRVMLTATAPDGRPVFRGRIPEEGAAPAGSPGTTTPSSGASAASTPVAAGASASFDAATRTAAAAHGRREQPRPGDGLGDPGADRSGLLESAGVAQHAERLSKGGPPANCSWSRRMPRPRRLPIATFSRAERLLVRVEAYSGDGAAPASFRATAQSRRDVDGGHCRSSQALLARGSWNWDCHRSRPATTSSKSTRRPGTGTAQELIAFKVSR